MTEKNCKFDTPIYTPSIKGNNSNLVISGGGTNNVIFDGIIDFSTATHIGGKPIGDVKGPSSVTTNTIPRFDTSSSLKSSNVTISDIGEINIPTGAEYKINGVSILSVTNVNVANVSTTQSNLSLTSNSKGILIESTGNIRATDLHNNASSQGNATQQDIRSGSYTPILTAVSNVAASTSSVSQWLRVGNVVTVSGQVSITPTVATDTLTRLGISLPVLSNFTASSEVSGTAVAIDSAVINGRPAKIIGDTINARASLEFLAAATIQTNYSFTFTYVVV